jgi:hypothetical protein
MDLITLDTKYKSKYIYCFTIIDHFTKLAFSHPIKNKTGFKIVRCLDKAFTFMGLP